MLTNRTQRFVLGFGALMWISLVVILPIAPEVYAEDFRRFPVNPQNAKAGFLAAITGMMALLGAGIVRRWRWTFWLLAAAFLSGVLRIPVALAELQGALTASGPTWFLVLQAFLGLVQFALGLLMVAGYRRSDIWGPF